MYILYCTVYTVYCTLYNVHYTMYIVHLTVYNVKEHIQKDIWSCDFEELVTGGFQFISRRGGDEENSRGEESRTGEDGR